MFGTLHCKSHIKEAEFIERPHGSLDPEKTSACDRCRAKKVRCNTNFGDCSRCKHLGETCTFSYTKNKGYQRKRKASVNIGQQECSLDFLLQSSASSSSKDARHEEGVVSEKRAFASALSVDGDVDNERGRQLLAEPQTETLADSPPDFLAEFDQLHESQDGDDFLNLSFSPSTFFSTISPSTHPEPIQPASAKTSDGLLTSPLNSGDEIPASVKTPDNFLTPPLSSRDEIPCYFPPIRQSQVSRAFSYQSPSRHSCQCLAAVAFAVEELEASCSSGNRSDLDSIVAYKKEAIKCCRSMLKCSSCMAKRENLVLLVFMAEKIVAACARIVELYRVKNSDPQANSAPSSLLNHSPLDRLSHCINIADQDLLTSTSSSSSKTSSTHSISITSLCTGASSSSSSDWQELLPGDYEISSPLEWEHVVRVLIFLQLREVMELLAEIKNAGSNVLGETQMAGLVQAEIKAGRLKKDIYAI